MRYPSLGYVSKDQNGQVLPGATVAVFLAGTNTPAKIYAASAGGTSVNSIVSNATTGFFQFWVDTGDYATTQLFDIYISLAIFPNIAYQGAVLYNTAIFPPPPVASDGTSGLTTTQTFKDGTNTTKTLTIKNGLITGIA